MGSATLKRTDDGPEIVYQTEDLRRTRQKVNRLRARYCSSSWWGLPYPPGGPEKTGMLRCTRCPAWFPRVAARYLMWDAAEEVGRLRREDRAAVVRALAHFHLDDIDLLLSGKCPTRLTIAVNIRLSKDKDTGGPPVPLWEPVCLDCWFADMAEHAMAFVCRLPSAIRYDQATNRSDLTAHMDGFQSRARRRRYLEGWRECTVRELVTDEAGTEHEIIAPPPAEQSPC